MIKNIIFDWSGTLSNDLVPVYKSLMEVFKELGIKKMTLNEFQDNFSLPYVKFFNSYVKVSKEKIDRLFLNHFSGDDVKLFPNVKNTLDFLKNKNVKMVILSSHPQSKIEMEIKDYKLNRYFDEVVGGINDKRKIIIDLIERNNFKPKETIYVGDMVHDIMAGKEAHIKTVAITWGYNSKQRLLSANPDYTIDKIGEIKNIINKL